MRTTTPCVFLSLNAACSALLMRSALASLPGRDQAVHFHHRGVLLAAGDAVAAPVDRHQQDERDVGKGQQLEEDAPQPRTPLLLQRRRGELGDELAFPLTGLFSHRRIL
jgi:hypothetical protein